MASGLIILPFVRLTLIILASRVVYTSLYIIPRLAALICARLILITLFGGLSVLVLIALFGRFIVLPLITFTNGLIITTLVSWVTLIRLTLVGLTSRVATLISRFPYTTLLIIVSLAILLGWFITRLVFVARIGRGVLISRLIALTFVRLRITGLILVTLFNRVAWVFAILAIRIGRLFFTLVILTSRLRLISLWIFRATSAGCFT